MNFVELLIAGLSNGATYALLAMAIALVFRVSRVLNLAQGEFATLGAMLPVWAAAHWHMNIYLALAVAVAISTAVGFLSARVALVPPLRRQAPVVELLSVTIALALLFEGALYLIFGRDTYYATPLIGGSTAWTAGSLDISKETVLLLAVGLAIGALLSCVLRYTGIGWVLRACADNGPSARMLGADVPMLTAYAFALAALISCVAGFLLAPAVPFNYLTGFSYMLQALVAGSLVAFRSPLLAGLAGLGIGIIQALVAGYLTANYQTFVTFVILVIVLVANPARLRPQGLPATGGQR
jgi:branched-chain amino acid transport system permease protein